MAYEIERKFLVINDDWKSQVSNSAYYRQAYLAGNDRSSVRVRIADSQAWLNIKSATLGIQRTEYEYEIPVSDAGEMIANLCQGATIDKWRHFVPHAGHVWEIDVFEGANQGLVVAEIELDDVAESFEKPPWIGAEVSDDPRYYNVCLVEHPYCDWEK